MALPLGVGLGLYLLGMCRGMCRSAQGMASRSRPQQRNVGWLQEFLAVQCLDPVLSLLGPGFSSWLEN